MNGRRFASTLFTLVGAVAAFGGCGGDADKPPDVVLTAYAEWRTDPGSVAEVGHHVKPDISWINGSGPCVGVPAALRVTVNEIEAIRIGTRADCDHDALFDAGPITTPDPVTVRAFDGDRLIGAATVAQAFAGTRAALVSPPDGQIRPGDEVVVSIPENSPTPLIRSVYWYWLGAAAAVPPFHTLSEAKLGADGSSFTTTVPAMDGLQGPVALVLPTDQLATPEVTSCTGFITCEWNEEYTLGPITLTVLGP